MISIEVEGLDELIDNFSNYVKFNDKATRDAMNKALSSATRQSTHKAKKGWKGMLLKDFKKHIEPRKAKVNDLTAGITISSKPIPLIQFKGKWKPEWSGASYKLKGRQRRMIGSFINKSKISGKQHILKRKTKKRYPLHPYVAITPTSMFIADDVKADKLFVEVFIKKFTYKYVKQLKRFNITN